MLSALCVLSSFSFVAGAQHSASLAADCRKPYTEVFDSPVSTPEERCKALVVYSKCLAQFDVDPALQADLFDKNEALCEPYFTKVDSPAVRTHSDNLELLVDSGKAVLFHQNRRETVNLFTMSEQIALVTKQIQQLKAQLKQNVTAIKANIKSSKDKLDKDGNNFKKEIGNSKDDMVASINKMLKSMENTKSLIMNTVEDQIDEVKDQVKVQTDRLSAEASANSTRMQKSVANTISQLESHVTATIKKLNAQKDGNISLATKNMNDAITKAKGDVADPKLHLWSGGSKGHSHGHGWSEFVLDRVEYDTGKPYFEKQTNTRFRALKDGLFRMRLNYMHHTHNNCYRQAQLYVANRHVIAPLHMHQSYWNEAYLEVTWHVKKGQQMYFRAKTDCGNPYRWHAGGSWRDAYNRVQVQYVGQFSGKCSGTNQGLC